MLQYIFTRTRNSLMHSIHFDIMNTKFNLSFLNESNTQMYINPANNRQLDDDFDPDTSNFTWTVTSFINETMRI